MKTNFLPIFLLIGLVMGLLLTWQFKTNIPIEGDYPTDEIAAKEILLKSFLDEQAYLQSRIVTLRKQIDESQAQIESYSETANMELLDDLKREIGLTEISGEGLEVLLDDSPLVKREGQGVTDANLVQASDIRDIVNVLNSASVSAISINNQRIIADSPISSVGTTLLVNNSHIAPPFVISAVGDSDIMLQRLLNKSLLPDIYARRKDSKIAFQIFKKNRISIPIYNGDLKTSYLNLVEK